MSTVDKFKLYFNNIVNYVKNILTYIENIGYDPADTKKYILRTTNKIIHDIKNIDFNNIQKYDTPPISFVPNIDPHYNEQNDNSTIRRIYVGLLLISLPIAASFRLYFGVRYISYRNLFFSFISIYIIGMNIRIATDSFYIPLYLIDIPVSLALIAVPTIIVMVFFGRRLFLIALSLFMTSFLVIYTMTDQDFEDSLKPILLFMFLPIIISARKAESIRHENSYFYGFSIFNVITKNRIWVSAIESLAYLIITSIMLFIFGYDANISGPFFTLTLICITCHMILAVMQYLAIKQYNQDLSDAKSGRPKTNEDQALKTHAVKSIRG